MDTTKILADLKKRPGFTENVGMVLVHNGVVRGWARADHAPVKSMKVSHDRAKMDAICREMEQQPGIFCIHAEAVEGELKPGDDVLFLVVAGDIREHVKATFSELLDRIKAEAVMRATGLAAIADDSGLIVDVMGNAPGILSARWAGEHGNDKANNALLLKQLADIPDSKRTARFRCAAALVVPGERKADGADDDKPYTIASETVEVGEMPGVLLRAPRGANGFGYDPLFVPNDQPQRAVDAGEKLTSAEMEPAEKNAVSHRGKALRALVASIEALVK